MTGVGELLLNSLWQVFSLVGERFDQLLNGGGCDFEKFNEQLYSVTKERKDICFIF